MRAVVLGGGRVGATIAKDLAAGGEFQVLVADLSRASLEKLEGFEGISVRQSDLSDPAEVARALEGADIAVGAVPGFMGFDTVKAVLEAGKPVVDISFFGEDPFELDGLARKKGLAAIMDCGIAPGCSNLIAGRLEKELEVFERFECYVGGLPAVRTWPYEYKAPFSPSDVLEEYTRPARLVEHGEVVTRQALSEPELMDFPGVGTLEAFNTDGLRTLIRTVKGRHMKEKTLRYPGHIETMRVLRESGFLSKEPVQVGGASVRPLDLTSRLLFPLWQLGEGEEDVTVMRVIGEGTIGGAKVRHQFDLLDRYDGETGTTSMARTTGYTCTAVVRALARGLYKEPGVSPPEYLGRDPEVYAFLLHDLATRGVVFRGSVT